ncbi:MAG TPA: WG repeat-containing protein [Pyrinomonadaceae bacterium]|nr:WG repeat-containing protein [Pyrinomonadaceae bacterium]
MKLRLKLGRIFILLWFVAVASLLPCAAQSKRVRNHAGLHPVADSSGKYGFIDRTGRFRIPPRYNGAGQFSEGVAYVWLWEGNKRRDGIVDTDGNFKELPATNDYEFIFHDGLARFQTPSGQERKYGYMDKTGRVVIEPQFYNAGHFSEGLAWVAMLVEGKWLYGFIDRAGKFAVPPQFTEQPGDFVEGLARVAGRYNYGFIDRTGKFQISENFQQLDEFFSEGLVAASFQGDPPRGVYLQRDGRVAFEIPLWHERTARQRNLHTFGMPLRRGFNEGLAPVVSFNKVGFIDKTGRVVIAPLFRETSGFSEGLAAVKIIGSDGHYVWGYIDRTGKFAVTPQFKDARPFAGGLAQVSTFEGSQRLIDRSGKVIWQLSK